MTLVVGEPVDLTDLIEDIALTAKERYENMSIRIMEEITNLKLTDSRGE